MTSYDEQFQALINRHARAKSDEAVAVVEQFVDQEQEPLVQSLEEDQHRWAWQALHALMARYNSLVDSPKGLQLLYSVFLLGYHLGLKKGYLPEAK